MPSGPDEVAVLGDDVVARDRSPSAGSAAPSARARCSAAPARPAALLLLMPRDDLLDRQQALRGDLAALGEDFAAPLVEVDQHRPARSGRLHVYRLAVPAIAAGRRLASTAEVDDDRRPFDRHVERDVERRRRARRTGRTDTSRTSGSRTAGGAAPAPRRPVPGRSASATTRRRRSRRPRRSEGAPARRNAPTAASSARGSPSAAIATTSEARLATCRSISAVRAASGSAGSRCSISTALTRRRRRSSARR